LGYQGLGEFLCFFAFGPLGVSAAYYSQTQNWSWVCLATSIIVAIPITLVLFCSHFHQVEDDINAGKKSPIVRLGTERGAKLLPWFCGSIFILTGGFVLWGIFPIWTLLSFVAIPSGIKLCRHVSQYHNQPNLVSNCKFIAIALQFWSGLFLGIGLILG
jgi:1,4-dihydroxy-2-naphthoate octaprenyltransferase